MVVKILRWIKGYIIFTAIGKFPERFINLMNVNGIRYWDSQPCKGGFTATMLLSDYLNIRKTAKRAKVRLKAKKKVGLPFFIKKYKKRKGLLVGGIAALLIITILSQFIWVVDIQGENNLSEQEIRPVLKSYGLDVGVLKSSVNGNKIERNTLLEVSELRWMSVNMLNNIATVEVQEKELKPAISKEYPSNIKADCDGVVTKASVENGTNQVKVGSAVVKNQVLVNSVMTDGAEGLKYVHSKAEILADVCYDKVLKMETKDTYLIQKKNYTTKTINNFLWFSVPYKVSSSLDGEKVSIFKNYRLELNDVSLPMGFTEEKDYYFIKESKTRNNKKILKNKLALYEIFNESNSEIKSRKMKFIEKNDILLLSVSYIVNKNIGVEQKIHIKS